MSAGKGASAQADEFVRVSTKSGRLVGIKRGAVNVFKGVPYAAPPVGALRWRPPQAVSEWVGDRFALEFGPAPIQEFPPRASMMYRLNFDDRRALVMSEDCLYLNVWSPDLSAGRDLPVLVWLHGGANRVGHGGQDLFDGSSLAARGVVIVSINMRLGALGFLSLPGLAQEDSSGASGNYGLQDVVAALGWVQANIASFGGDPRAVTLAGNSAGAAMVTHLMAATAAQGLFQGAIGQSASGVFRPEGRMTTQEEAAEAGRVAAAQVGSSLEVLRAQPATAFLRVPPQSVIVDGRLLVEDTTDVFIAGRQAKIPLLVGWNEDEGALYASPGAADELMPKGVGDRQRALLDQVYPALAGQAGVASRRALVGDRRFAYPVWRWARTHAETARTPTWLYRFNHRLPLPADLPPPPDGGEDYGTFHSAELPYTWDNLDVRPWAWTDGDRATAARVSDAWLRFVTRGDPNGDGLPTWDRFDASSRLHQMNLGTAPHMEAAPRREAFGVFDDLYLGEGR